MARAHRLRAVFVPGDEWAPLSMVSRCHAAGVPADVLESDAQSTMQHAFSIKDDSCTRVAEWTAGAVERMLAAGASSPGSAKAPLSRRLDERMREQRECRGALPSAPSSRRRSRSPAREKRM